LLLVVVAAEVCERLMSLEVDLDYMGGEVARPDGGHLEGGVQVLAGAPAVKLTRARINVRGAVGLDPRLGLEYAGAGAVTVKGNSLEHAAHGLDAVFANTCVLSDILH